MILITGGAGFIGANFAISWLSECDEAIVNIDLLSEAGNLENLASLRGDCRHTFVRGDICDEELVTSLLREHNPRAIVHFAAESHVDRSIHDPGAFVRTNVNGTYVLLHAAQRYCESLASAERDRFRFLHVSTDEVYGSLGLGEPGFSEKHPLQPNSPYSASKASADLLVRAWHHTYGLATLTSNCSNNYGPSQFPEKLIPLMIVNALAGKHLPIYGDGLQIRDWLYVADHCAALREILRNGKPGETYNIGGGNERTNIEIVEAICHILDRCKPREGGGSYREQIRHVRDRPGHDRRYAIDARKIETELGWNPSESFESGLEKTVRWYLANEEWVSNVNSGEYLKWIEKNYAGRS